ncbi:unnamed protein product [Rotaria sordida]|uniref:Uncharacterized protein n=1 Tax=Rotaria sordida TaxID=392033 RepID=A0A813RQ32_9BILA|nr:unnamed protein product [Rotaria sordida]
MTGTTANLINGGGFTAQTGTGTLDTKSTAATPIPASVTWAGTVRYSSSSGQTIVNGEYTSLNGSGGARTLSTSTIKISSSFTPGSGTYTNTGSTIEFNGTSTQSIPTVTGSYNNLTVSNTAAVVSASGSIVVNGALSIASNAILDMVTNTLSGTLSSITGSGTIRTQHTATSAPLAASKTWTQTVEYNNATGGQTVVGGTYTTLIISNTSNTNTAGAAIATTNLTLNSGSVLDMTTFALTGLGGTISGSTGTLRTQETSSSPIPSAKTWPGTIIYDASGSQTIVLGTYNNLTASGGARTLDAAGTINISGTFTPGSGTYTNTSSTVLFNGSGSQNVPAISPAYNDLTISNTGTKSMTGNVTVAGTLTLSTSSDFLSIGSNTLALQGSTSLTGTLIGSSSSNLTISGSAGGSPTITFSTSGTNPFLNTLTLNRTGSGAGLTLGTNISITNLLSVTNGTLDITGRTVTLKSTSLTNTAQVGPVTGSISYGGTGNFTVERFIPLGNRAYRDIAPGVNTSASTYIFDTWQEAGSAPAGYGTHVTGLAGASPGGVDATTGLDITQTGAATLFTYVNGIFSSVTNTKTTKPNVYQVTCPVIAQIGNNPPPSSNSDVGQNNGSPFNNSNTGGGIGGSINGDADGGDPGGPTDPPDDIAPIDGGLGILLAIGLVHGYNTSRRRKNKKRLQVQYVSK